MDPAAGDAAFGDVAGENFVPAFTLCTGQKCRLNFGHNVDSLRFFTMCGLQVRKLMKLQGFPSAPGPWLG